MSSFKDSTSLRGWISATHALFELESELANARNRGGRVYSIQPKYFLELVSRNKLLTKLILAEIPFERPSLVENVLARARTLTELTIGDSCVQTSEVYHAFRRGFQRNNTLKKLHWISTKQSAYVEEVFFGISNHPTLRTLVLDGYLTRASSQALRSCLCTNGTIDYLSIRLRPTEKHEYSALEPILLGLACNRGVTHFRMTDSTLTRTNSCAIAWVELLQKNTSMKKLALIGCSIGREDAAAIAQGIGGNTSLEKLDLTNISTSYGPAWQAMLTRNHSLKEIILSTLIARDEFGYFARGFAHNTSVKSLSLKGCAIGSTEVNALAFALLGNDTLESLSLRRHGMPGAEDAAAVESLWQNDTLKHLTISDCASDDDVTGFPTVLLENCTLETIDLSENTLGLNHCHAICESLRRSSCLRELNLSGNDIVLDDHGAQALNDLLENTPLRMMDVSQNQITTQGIAVLAHGLRGNSFLRELRLEFCGIRNDGLIQLGEALVENSTLEIVRLEGNVFDQDVVSRFFQLLPQMDGLKELYLSPVFDMDSEELQSAVVDSLRENTSLQRLTGWRDIWHQRMPSDIKALIDFYLNLNRNGRKFLEPPLTSRVPAGLWPSVLTKMSSPQDTSLLYYFLQKKQSSWSRVSRMNRRTFVSVQVALCHCVSPMQLAL
jgi:Ran GTPase-activating protein (RanGAP) involved in mRNA processing and transport